MDRWVLRAKRTFLSMSRLKRKKQQRGKERFDWLDGRADERADQSANYIKQIFVQAYSGSAQHARFWSRNGGFETKIHFQEWASSRCRLDLIEGGWQSSAGFLHQTHQTIGKQAGKQVGISWLTGEKILSLALLSFLITASQQEAHVYRY